MPATKTPACLGRAQLVTSQNVQPILVRGSDNSSGATGIQVDVMATSYCTALPDVSRPGTPRKKKRFIGRVPCEGPIRHGSSSSSSLLYQRLLTIHLPCGSGTRVPLPSRNLACWANSTGTLALARGVVPTAVIQSRSARCVLARPWATTEALNCLAQLQGSTQPFSSFKLACN